MCLQVTEEYLGHITRCPSCGRDMSVMSQFIRIEQLTGRRALERVLICGRCNIKIKQYVQLA
jgi:C4-type Zn-finger protein